MLTCISQEVSVNGLNVKKQSSMLGNTPSLFLAENVMRRKRSVAHVQRIVYSLQMDS